MEGGGDRGLGGDPAGGPGDSKGLCCCPVDPLRGAKWGESEWSEEIERWTDLHHVTYHGKPSERAAIRMFEFGFTGYGSETFWKKWDKWQNDMYNDLKRMSIIPTWEEDQVTLFSSNKLATYVMTTR